MRFCSEFIKAMHEMQHYITLTQNFSFCSDARPDGRRRRQLGTHSPKVDCRERVDESVSRADPRPEERVRIGSLRSISTIVPFLQSLRFRLPSELLQVTESTVHESTLKSSVEVSLLVSRWRYC